MAEILAQPGNAGHKGGLRQRKKLSTRVDLTPMVDLGFLLITFFIITTSWSAPKSLRFYLPAGKNKDMPVPESTVLTIIPMNDDRIFYYHGDLDDARAHSMYGFTSYDIDHGIGNIIRNKLSLLNTSTRFNSDDLMLIIKPTNDATYKNIVDAMDEVLINGIKHYAVTETEKQELEILAELKQQ